mmetsp:Transcript_25445/g.74724  ORF Transcript_25445/g.74724 Transcript_25445/m.74724 type:complete len:201 (-) Transcript_25445:217-819(-)
MRLPSATRRAQTSRMPCGHPWTARTTTHSTGRNPSHVMPAMPGQPTTHTACGVCPRRPCAAWCLIATAARGRTWTRRTAASLTSLAAIRVHQRSTSPQTAPAGVHRRVGLATSPGSRIRSRRPTADPAPRCDPSCRRPTAPASRRWSPAPRGHTELRARGTCSSRDITKGAGPPPSAPPLLACTPPPWGLSAAHSSDTKS